MAAAGKEPVERFLAGADPVAVGLVEKVDTSLHRVVERRFGGRATELAPFAAKSPTTHA